MTNRIFKSTSIYIEWDLILSANDSWEKKETKEGKSFHDRSHCLNVLNSIIQDWIFSKNVDKENFGSYHWLKCSFNGTRMSSPSISLARSILVSSGHFSSWLSGRSFCTCLLQRFIFFLQSRCILPLLQSTISHFNTNLFNF